MTSLSRRSVLMAGLSGLAVITLTACEQRPTLADPAEPVPPSVPVRVSPVAGSV
jgi:hypothetical protein